MTKPNNNYAAPHTPIASVKRPRSSLNGSMLSPGAGGPPKGSSNDISLSSPPCTPSTIKEGEEDLDRIHDQLPMSPMHPARPLVIREDEVAGVAASGCTTAEALAGEDNGSSWVGRQVDALFSPVLNFLNGEEHEEHEAHAGEEGHGHHNTTSTASTTHNANDVPMDDTSTTAVDVVRKVVVIETSDTNTTSQETASHEEEEEEEQLEPPESEQQQEEEPVIEDDGSSQGSQEDDEDEFNPYVFIKSLPAYDLVAPLRPPIALPPKSKDAPLVSLVLDLDETLVHCTVEPVDDADLVFPVVFHGMTYQVHVRLRPHLFQFLEKIKGQYEVIVFTASQKVYANELLDLIDPGK
jgi:hypothetical protein